MGRVKIAALGAAVLLLTASAPPRLVAASECGPEFVLVFFAWRAVKPIAEADAHLDRAARFALRCEGWAIRLGGHVDTSEPERLGRKRNDWVRRYLIGRGVAPERIRAENFGMRVQRVATAIRVREPQNRRVEISFGPAEAPAERGDW